MDLSVQSGTYVVAVSGGVDSMALLDMLAKRPGLKLVVAHFDHGIRPDSRLDRQLVQSTAKQHGLPFVYHEGNLGPGTSEDVARKARYEFLHTIKQVSGARAIVTAHHHNDLLETAIINMLCGTNRRGLSSLQSNELVARPLLNVHKHQLQKYAQDQGLVWHEDSTNEDTRYLRNYVRAHILPAFSDADRKKLRRVLAEIAATNQELDKHLMHYLHLQPAADKLDRSAFVRLPHSVAREVLAAWLRNRGIRSFDTKTLERLVVASKTFMPGRAADITAGHRLRVSKNHLALEQPDR